MTSNNSSNHPLGAPAAERDTALKGNFVESETFRSLINGRCKILIGNRGAGKSALFEMYASHFKGQKKCSVIYIKPENYSYEMLQETLAKELDGAWAKQGSYAASWKYVLMCAAMTEARDKFSNSKDPSFKKVDGFLRKKFKQDTPDMLNDLLAYMKRFEEMKIGQGSVGLKADSLQGLYRLSELDGLQKHFETLLSEVKISFLIDELDRGWDGSEDARLFVAGLFQAVMSLNEISPHFSVLISIRRELYDNIPEIFDDAQKYRDLVRIVEWDESGLKSIAAKRIISASKLAPQTSDDEAWSQLFAPTLAYRKSDSFKYIVDRTLLRPREIIQFCNECIVAHGDRAELIDYDSISEAERRYSDDRFTDVCSEYRFQYPHLADVMNMFRGRVYRFSKSELTSFAADIILEKESFIPWLAAMNESDLINVLWKVGFIRGHAVGGQKSISRSGSRWVGSYTPGSYTPDMFDSLQVHPLFRSHLNMKEK